MASGGAGCGRMGCPRRGRAPASRRRGCARSTPAHRPRAGDRRRRGALSRWAGVCMYCRTGRRSACAWRSRRDRLPCPMHRRPPEFLFLALPSAASLVLLLSATVTATALWLGGREGREAAGAAHRRAVCLHRDRSGGAAAPAAQPGHEPRLPRAAAVAVAHPRGARRAVLHRRQARRDARSPRPRFVRCLPEQPGTVGRRQSRGASTQADFSPSAWRTRMRCSTYDLAVLWPRTFERMTQHFLSGGRHDRDLLLERAGVRYRVLSMRLAAGHTPIAQVPLLYESHACSTGAETWPGAYRSSAARESCRARMQGIDRAVRRRLGSSPDGDRRTRDGARRGNVRSPEPAGARITTERGDEPHGRRCRRFGRRRLASGGARFLRGGLARVG